MKRLAAPQIMVMFEILMQYLMVFMAQTSPAITIGIPIDTMFNGGKIVYTNKSSGKLLYLNGRNFEEADSKNFGTYYITRPCVGDICKEAKKVANTQDVSIAISGNLFEDLAQVTFLACNTNASQCNDLKFDIKANGNIDGDAFKSKNPAFSNIPGLMSYLN